MLARPPVIVWQVSYLNRFSFARLRRLARAVASRTDLAVSGESGPNEGWTVPTGRTGRITVSARVIPSAASRSVSGESGPNAKSAVTGGAIGVASVVTSARTVVSAGANTGGASNSAGKVW